MSDRKEERKEAYLRKLALLALRKNNINVSELAPADIAALPYPKKIRDIVAVMHSEKPTLTLQEVNKEILDIRTAPVEVEPVTVEKYDPQDEIKEIVQDFVEPKVEEKVEQEKVEEPVVDVVTYSEEELREVFSKVPETAKSANAILKKALELVEEPTAVDQKLATKISKELAAERKAKK